MRLATGPFFGILVAGTLTAGWAKSDTTINAASGLEVNPAPNSSCFEALWAEKHNTCSTTQALLIPMERVANGDRYVTVRFRGNGVSPTTCRPIVMTQTGDEIWYGDASWTATSWVWSGWAGFVHLPSQSTWFMNCWVAGTSGGNSGSVVRVWTDS